MILTALGQFAADHATHVRHVLALAPGSTPKEINTDAIVTFFATKIAPILLAVLGLIFIGRASKGEVSKVLTSSAIAIIGLAFVAGAATLFFVGSSLVDLVFK
jgi:hypothetical protein